MAFGQTAQGHRPTAARALSVREAARTSGDRQKPDTDRPAEPSFCSAGGKPTLIHFILEPFRYMI